jgi:F-type H+-transporting ATPase subunit a
MLSHLTPLEEPPLFFTLPFIVLIEAIGSIIRPITLAIRLIANIIAGHLLISLIGSSNHQELLSLSIIILGTEILSIILEIAVAFVQSDVFTILRTLYRSEI